MHQTEQDFWKGVEASYRRLTILAILMAVFSAAMYLLPKVL